MTPSDLRKVLTLIRKGGPLTIRDIDDDVLVEKNHPWASRKPSKRALQVAFYKGAVTISERVGMLKTYELMDRHFGWDARPRPASERQILDYLLERALRAQGRRERRFRLPSRRQAQAGHPAIDRSRRAPQGAGAGHARRGSERWSTGCGPKRSTSTLSPPQELVHILSPFDPLVIQRKRLQLFFDYEHRFEAYLPKEKRVFGYLALPVLIGDEVVAAIDLKTDRANRKLQIQQWTWVGRGSHRSHKRQIEEELHRFERFQLH